MQPLVDSSDLDKPDPVCAPTCIPRGWMECKSSPHRRLLDLPLPCRLRTKERGIAVPPQPRVLNRPISPGQHGLPGFGATRVGWKCDKHVYHYSTKSVARIAWLSFVVSGSYWGLQIPAGLWGIALAKISGHIRMEGKEKPQMV